VGTFHVVKWNVLENFVDTYNLHSYRYLNTSGKYKDVKEIHIHVHKPKEVVDGS
jgi:hypothetical protein